MTSMPTDLERVDILGVRVAALTIPRALGLIATAVASRSKIRFVFATVHTVTECQRQPALLEAVNHSVVAPDGMPLVWLSRRRSRSDVRRVYGPDMLIATCEDGLARGYRHFFYGSTDETVQALIARLSARFPGLAVAGAYSPPFRPLSAAEEDDVLARINAAEPDIVWVGLGMPRQELWIARYEERLNTPVLMAVGAAFDFHAGTVRQAPSWMQRAGLEWLFRLIQEPRRLWRRYLLGNSRFVWLLLRERLSGAPAKPPA